MKKDFLFLKNIAKSKKRKNPEFSESDNKLNLRKKKILETWERDLKMDVDVIDDLLMIKKSNQLQSTSHKN